ncbi:MAG: hypothetical protein CM15mP109_14560 [Candidatus Dadabacteria bacterium]|nr:MAG: hypothetical protein CM15mP109_14560 [Candidatus Dadabacteria bacterium]
MDLQLLTYLIAGASFALYIGIALWSKASSTNEFYIAGGGVHPIANGMATAADWMSAASFISMAGIISFMGKGVELFILWVGLVDMFYSLFIGSVFKKVWQIYST